MRTRRCSQSRCSVTFQSIQAAANVLSATVPGSGACGQNDETPMVRPRETASATYGTRLTSRSTRRSHSSRFTARLLPPEEPSRGQPEAHHVGGEDQQL